MDRNVQNIAPSPATSILQSEKLKQRRNAIDRVVAKVSNTALAESIRLMMRSHEVCRRNHRNKSIRLSYRQHRKVVRDSIRYSMLMSTELRSNYRRRTERSIGSAVKMQLYSHRRGCHRSNVIYCSDDRISTYIGSPFHAFSCRPGIRLRPPDLRPPASPTHGREP